MRKTINLHFEWIKTPEISGSGTNLSFKLEGHRTNKAGNVEHYEIECPMPRYCIERLARQIATMHARDRQRLQREMHRIELEQQAITQAEAEKQ